MRRILILFSVIVFSACEFLGLEKRNLSNEAPIASVEDYKLYASDIRKFFPKDITKEDSIVLARSLINKWGLKQLLLVKAEENSTEQYYNEVVTLVKNYKEELLISGYKEKLINQQLDTIVSDVELQDFYSNNQQNFKLNEELIKVKYIHLPLEYNNINEVKKQFMSGKIEDLDKLEVQQLNFKSLMLNDTVWTQLENVSLKLPFSKQELLKKTKLLQKEDSLGVYLVAVKDFLVRNEVAPYSYVKPSVKQIVLHKRKLEVIREIEKIIIGDAVQNKSFKIY